MTRNSPSFVRIMSYSVSVFAVLAIVGLLLDQIRENRIYEHCGNYTLCINAYTRRELGILQWAHLAYITSMIGLGVSIVGLSLTKIRSGTENSARGKHFFFGACAAFTVSVLITAAGFAMARAYGKGMETTFQCRSESFSNCTAEHRRSLGILNYSVEVIRIGVVATGVLLVYAVTSGGALAYCRIRKRIYREDADMPS